MDFSALLIIVGSGATINVLADLNKGREAVVPMLGAAFLLVILTAVGRVSGQWGLVSALAALYLLASLFKNYKNVPALASVLEQKGKQNG